MKRIPYKDQQASNQLNTYFDKDKQKAERERIKKTHPQCAECGKVMNPFVNVGLYANGGDPKKCQQCNKEKRK